MTAPLKSLWCPGDPLPRRANRLTLQTILSHELGASIGPRFVELLAVKSRLVGGQRVWPVDEVIRAALNDRRRVIPTRDRS